MSRPGASRTGEAAAASGARRVQLIVNLGRRGGGGEASPSRGVAVAAAAALGALQKGPRLRQNDAAGWRDPAAEIRLETVGLWPARECVDFNVGLSGSCSWRRVQSVKALGSH